MLSKNVSIVLTACLFFTVINLSSAQQNAKCLAVITGIKGDVLIKKVNETDFLRTSWGAQLFNGDQVKTTSNSEATLAFSNNSIVKLGMGSQITISGDETIKGSTVGSVKNISTGTMLSLSEVLSKKERVKDEGAMGDLRSVNGESLIDLSAPVNTLINTLRPSFSWSAKGSFSAYIVTLYNNKGQVWKKRVTGNQLDYPENEKELDAGVSYFWNVEGETLIDIEKSDNKKFSTPSLGRSKEIAEQENNIRKAFGDEPESSSLHSLLGSYYLNQGLFQDALTEFRKVSEMNSEAPMPHEVLGSLYSSIGNKDKAIEELQKALALSKGKTN
jgi:hypothetical protein